MKTTAKNLSETKVELTVTLEKEDLKKARVLAIEQLAKQIKVAGFRKGKVPADVAEQHLNPNDISSQTIDLAVRMTVPEAFNQAKKVALQIPNVEVTKYVPDETAEYKLTADILPDVKVGPYKNLKVKKEKAEVKEKDIQEILDGIAKSRAEKKAVKRAAKLGDEVIIDFTGKKDGKPFDGGSSKDYTLLLGSKTFIPGFEDGIVGHEPGDKFDVPLTFPKDYGAKHLAGKKVVFEILVKQVNEVTPPKFDADFAKACGPFKNMDELKADIKKNLEAQNAHRIEEKYKDDLVTALVKGSKVAAPEVMIEDQVRMIRDDITRNAAAQGLGFDDYLKQTGQTEEDWSKEVHKIGEARVKASLVLQVLARDQKISADDKEVDAKIAELRDVYQKSPEALKNLKDPRVRQDIKNRLTIEKVLDFLLAENK
ncbi:trigger factor [Candidatus Saccharibacteria bacterium]|nr:trigger factor [Candidatus Saccharibacteria bacterium]MBQ9017308.1 trigger factor [Candidatus Saccharibacteria bacterium]